jgi:hypothetical protein
LSAQYLPAEVRPYASSFDNHGSWQYQATYGYVWYPRVATGWRPYYHGRWTHLRPYGWTWIGVDPWAWPTHHYGRWGFSAGVWFWIPGRHWAPAWVSWGYAPGYVSWCPLGWNNRPVFGFSSVHYRSSRFGPWHAWTVVPHRRFGHGFVNVNVVNVNTLDGRTRTAFTERRTPPEIRGYAIPRATAPIRLAGTRSGSSVGNAAPAAQLSSPGVRRPAITRDGGSVSSPSERRGFPPAAREPRPGAITRSGERAQPRSGGTVQSQPAEGSAPASGRGSSIRSAPRRGGDAPAAEAPSAAPSSRAGAPRATPRAGSAPAPATSGGGSVRSAPRGRGDAPAADAPTSRPSTRAGAPRATPRGGPAPSPSPSSSGNASAPTSAAPSSAAPSARPRAVPRSRGGVQSPARPSSAYQQAPRAYGSPETVSPAPYRSTRPDVARDRGAVVPYAAPDRSIRRGPMGTADSPAPPSYAPRPRMEAPTRNDAPRSYGPAPSRGGSAARPDPGPSRAPSVAQPRGGSGGPAAAAPSRGSAGGSPSRGAARPRGGR